MRLNKTFDSKYIFKLAKNNDYKEIMKFLRENWNPKNHILSKNVNFFHYEFSNINNLNFLLAIDRKNFKISALQGFIPYSENIYKSHICASITCVNLKSTTPFLGIETMIRMLHLLKPKTYCGIGTNPITMLPLVKRYLNRYTGKLTHYYLFNKNKKNFEIANFPKINFIYENYKNINSKHIFYREITSFSFLEKNFEFKKFENLPFKSKEYIYKRYFKHPVYNYRFFYIKNKRTNLRSLFIIRKLKFKNSAIIRFVDFIGDINDFFLVRNIANNLFKKENIEYIDFYAARLPNIIKKKIKFRIITSNDKNIIPDYFEPFEKKNVKIFYETSNNKIILFKADADQDRPRLQQKMKLIN